MKVIGLQESMNHTTSMNGGVAEIYSSLEAAKRSRPDLDFGEGWYTENWDNCVAQAELPEGHQYAWVLLTEHQVIGS